MIEFIAKLKKETKFRSDAILEKSIYAFSLLEGLVKIYPDLIFKGGTSIFIRQFPPIRFSIDVDIILQEKEKEGTEERIRSIIGKMSQFKKVAPDEKRNKKNISHYYFYYDSVVSKKEEYVLLDILYSDNPYSTIESHVVDLPLIQSGNKFEVIIPTIEGLYADKLVAIADNRLVQSFIKTFTLT
jgi:predicted nucleotidyltransferase component of viral defense system